MTWQAVSMVGAAVVFDDAAPEDDCETVRVEGEPRRRRALADRIAAALNANYLTHKREPDAADPRSEVRAQLVCSLCDRRCWELPDGECIARVFRSR